MTSPSERQKVSIEKGFLQRWIFTNAVAVGIGLGLPMTVASLLSPDGHGNFLLMAVFCLGLWLGIAQWLILRKFCPLPRSWIFISAAMPWLAMVVAFGFITIHPMVGVTFMILSLPCFLGLGQWQVLRQAVRPVGRWPLITVVAIVLGTLLSMASVPLMASLISPLGLIYAICGGLGGGIYGAITGLEFSLKQWQQQKYLMPSKPTQKPTYDVPPNSSLRGWYILQTLVAVVVFSVWGWLVTYQFTIPPDRNPLFGLLSLLLILFIIQPLSVFIHELGHFLGAKLNGAELAFLGINRWIFIPSGGGFRINKSRRLIAAGFVQTVPTSLSHIDRKLFLMLLGGPMGSFCLFLATATPFFFPGWTSQNPLAWKISLLSVINLIMFITNLVPFKFGHMLTDGRRMLDLLQNNVYGQRFAALYAYETSLRKGVRPKEMQPSLVDRA
ncbi:MAG: M50 family metallopeptidase, partial [Cyanobacteria bacterium P01_C01_bin.118]